MPLSFHDLPPNLQVELDRHWRRVSPREAVGLILSDGSVLPLRNWSKGKDRFKVGFWSILWNLGWGALRHGDGIRYVYHSHTGTSNASAIDRAFMMILAKRWPGVDHLIYVPGNEYSIWQYVE